MQGLVKVHNFAERAFADQAQDLLRQQGVECLLQGDDVMLLGPQGTGHSETLGGVDLYVNPEDAERARELLDAIFGEDR